MKRSHKHALTVGAVAVVAASSAGFTYAAASDNDGPERASEATFTDAHRSAAAVSETSAVTTALARHPGTATDVHLEDEGGGLRWEVKPVADGQVWEVQVDAQSGQIVSDQPDE
jgi:uncharacterized membrane protein YkoI